MSFNSILLWCVGGAGLDAQSSTQPQHQHAATKHKRNSLVSLFVYKWRTQLEWEWLTYSKHGHTNEAPWAMVQLSHLCPAPPWPHSGRLLTCSVFTPLHLACELFSFHFNVGPLLKIFWAGSIGHIFVLMISTLCPPSNVFLLVSASKARISI